MFLRPGLLYAAPDGALNAGGGDMAFYVADPSMSPSTHGSISLPVGRGHTRQCLRHPRRICFAFPKVVLAVTATIIDIYGWPIGIFSGLLMLVSNSAIAYIHAISSARRVNLPGGSPHQEIRKRMKLEKK